MQVRIIAASRKSVLICSKSWSALVRRALIVTPGIGRKKGKRNLRRQSGQLIMSELERDSMMAGDLCQQEIFHTRTKKRL